MNNVIDLRQHTINEMQQEIMFLKGQNEAFLKMLSYIVKQTGGEFTVPKDFPTSLIGLQFDIIPQEDGYLLKTSRPEPTEETSQPTE